MIASGVLKKDGKRVLGEGSRFGSEISNLRSEKSSLVEKLVFFYVLIHE
jgi:hypothetical protein